jgi:hypothetical protein
LLNPSTHAEITDRIIKGENRQFRYFPDNILVDRLEMIQDVDLIVSKAKIGHYLGWPLLLSDVKAIFPAFLVNKSAYADVDEISFHYGTRPQGLVGFPTVGLFASAFAMFGWLGGSILTYLVILMNFLILKFIAGSSLYKNVWTIFLMALLWLSFSERSVQALIVSILREVPSVVIVILFVLWFLKGSSKTNHRLNRVS